MQEKVAVASINSLKSQLEKCQPQQWVFFLCCTTERWKLFLDAAACGEQ